MKGKVMTFSKKGHTMTIAQAISRATGFICDKIPPSYPLEGDAIAFIGSGIYAGKAGKPVMEMISQLSKERVKRVALFCTSTQGNHTMDDAKQALKAKGIEVVGSTFCAKGQFLFFNGGRPNQQDIDNAAKWAKDILAGIKDE